MTMVEEDEEEKGRAKDQVMEAEGGGAFSFQGGNRLSVAKTHLQMSDNYT